MPRLADALELVKVTIAEIFHRHADASDGQDIKFTQLSDLAIWQYVYKTLYLCIVKVDWSKVRFRRTTQNWSSAVTEGLRNY